jgi:tRNA-binding protein
MITITYEEFERVNLRSGTIVKAEEFPRAKKTSIQSVGKFWP